MISIGIKKEYFIKCSQNTFQKDIYGEPLKIYFSKWFYKSHPKEFLKKNILLNVLNNYLFEKYFRELPKIYFPKWIYKSHPKEFSKRIFYLMFSKNTFQKDNY